MCIVRIPPTEKHRGIINNVPKRNASSRERTCVPILELDIGETTFDEILRGPRCVRPHGGGASRRRGQTRASPSTRSRTTRRSTSGKCEDNNFARSIYEQTQLPPYTPGYIPEIYISLPRARASGREDWRGEIRRPRPPTSCSRSSWTRLTRANRI